jgi:hypothetical protein
VKGKTWGSALGAEGKYTENSQKLESGRGEAFSIRLPFGLWQPKTPLLTQSGWRLEAGSCEQRAVAVVVAVAVAVAGERVKDAVEKADEKPEGEDVQGEDTIPEGPN